MFKKVLIFLSLLVAILTGAYILYTKSTESTSKAYPRLQLEPGSCFVATSNKVPNKLFENDCKIQNTDDTENIKTIATIPINGDAYAGEIKDGKQIIFSEYAGNGQGLIKIYELDIASNQVSKKAQIDTWWKGMIFKPDCNFTFGTFNSEICIDRDRTSSELIQNYSKNNLIYLKYITPISRIRLFEFFTNNEDVSLT